MEDTSNVSVIVRGVSNLVIDAVIALPCLILLLIGTPSHRGFFCNDESLNHPYKDNTVTDIELYLYGFLMPLLFISVVEVLGRTRLPQEGPTKPNRSVVPSIILNIFIMYVGYLFGAASSQCITDLCKYSVGRLRPHFFAVCNVDFAKLNCTGPNNEPLFIPHYECHGNPALFNNDYEEMESKLKDARVSFLSGHASFSFQASVFVAIYLQARGRFILPEKRRGFFLVPFFQFLVLAVASYISVSRVFDNKHHPTDVLAGVILGVLVQVINTNWVLRLFHTENKYHPISNGVNSATLENGNMEVMNGHTASMR